MSRNCIFYYTGGVINCVCHRWHGSFANLERTGSIGWLDWVSDLHGNEYKLYYCS